MDIYIYTIYTRCMYIVRVIKVIMPTDKKKKENTSAMHTHTHKHTHRGPLVMDVFVEPKGISDGIMYYTGPGTTAADDKNTINVRAAMYTLDKPCPRITRRQLVPCSTDRRPFRILCCPLQYYTYMCIVYIIYGGEGWRRRRERLCSWYRFHSLNTILCAYASNSKYIYVLHCT